MIRVKDSTKRDGTYSTKHLDIEIRVREGLQSNG